MKTISIRELHNRTGHFVREGGVDPIFVTERGEKIAMLVPISNEFTRRVSFPKRTVKQLIPLADGARDSAKIISEERDRE